MLPFWFKHCNIPFLSNNDQTLISCPVNDSSPPVDTTGPPLMLQCHPFVRTPASRTDAFRGWIAPRGGRPTAPTVPRGQSQHRGPQDTQAWRGPSVAPPPGKLASPGFRCHFAGPRRQNAFTSVLAEMAAINFRWKEWWLSWSTRDGPDPLSGPRRSVCLLSAVDAISPALSHCKMWHRGMPTPQALGGVTHSVFMFSVLPPVCSTAIVPFFCAAN